MLILVDANNGIPVYRQVVDQVRLLVATGRIQPGDELPSTRVLSLRLGVNPMTISKAYGLLEEEGIVVRRPGLPLIVAPRNDKHGSGKLEQLSALLQPVALATVQMGISEEKAAEVFCKLIEKNKTNGEKSE